MSSDHYTETQRFNQWWLWVLLITISLFQIYAFFMSDEEIKWSMLIMLTLHICLILVFLIYRLKTYIDKEFVKIQLYPFYTKKIKRKDIVKAEIVDYGFVGGWGIRVTTQYGIIYNTKGSKGLLIDTAGNKRFCIGTQKPEELSRHITKTSTKIG